MKSTEFHELKDMIESLALAARQSGVPSAVLLEIRNKLDNHIAIHEEDIRKINEKLDPVYKAFQTASGFKATVLLIATTLGGIWASVEAFKKLTGK
jgi:hypothetical protein